MSYIYRHMQKRGIIFVQTPLNAENGCMKYLRDVQKYAEYKTIVDGVMPV